METRLINDSFNRLALCPDITQKLRHLALALTRDPVATDELVQEALYRALCRWGTYFQDRPAFPWIRSILVHAWVDRVRLNSRFLKFRYSLIPVHDREVDDVSAAAERAETARAVHATIARLPNRYRRMLKLRMEGDMSHETMAAILGCPTGTLKSRMNRAWSAFRNVYDFRHRSFHVRENA